MAACMSENVGDLLQYEETLMCFNAIRQIPSKHQHNQVHPASTLAEMGPEELRLLYAGQICWAEIARPV